MGRDVTVWLYQGSEGNRSRSASLFMGQRLLDREAHAITQSPRRILELNWRNHSRLFCAVQE
jgi:hypothetical protein